MTRTLERISGTYDKWTTSAGRYGKGLWQSAWRHWNNWWDWTRCSRYMLSASLNAWPLSCHSYTKCKIQPQARSVTYCSRVGYPNRFMKGTHFDIHGTIFFKQLMTHLSQKELFFLTFMTRHFISTVKFYYWIFPNNVFFLEIKEAKNPRDS